MAFPFAALIPAIASLAGGVMQSRGADAAAKAGTPNPFSVFGPAGGMFVNPNTRQLQLSMANNPFAQMFNALGASGLANAATAPGSFLYGANPEVAEAYKGLFGQGLTDTIQSQLDLLRAEAAPEENRQRLGLDDQLFSRGMLGTTGGAERFRALTEAQGQADLRRQISATELGRQAALDRFGGALQGVGQGMAGQLQNFNIGQGAFGGLQGLFQNLIQQAGLGVGAQSGVPPQLAMYQAQANMAPYQAGFNFLNQSGIFDRLGSLFGGGGGGGAPLGSSPSANFNPNLYG